MYQPLKTMTVTVKFGVAGSAWYHGKHMGVDLRASVGTPIYAPEGGVINERYIGTKDIKVLGLKGKYLHRFLHLDAFAVKLGQKVKAGQLIGYTGDSGGVLAHLHWDVRKLNTLWTDAFSNYFDPMKLITKETAMKPTRSDIGNAHNYLGIADKDVPEKTYKYYETKRENVLFWDVLKKLYTQKKDLQKRVSTLEAQVGDAGKWQTFKVLLRELIK